MPRFAQHFLINKHAIERIVATVNPSPTDFIVEIGPGKGAITSQLIELCHHLTVIEVDPVWADRLQKNFGHKKNLDIVLMDVLKFDFQSLLKINPRWKVVGNLPYNLTSPILRKLCEWDGWQEGWVMVQKEVGDRMTARPATPDYGALTVGLNLTCTMEKIFDLSPRSFDPPPKIDSSIVKLTKRTTPLTDNVAASQRVIQAAFQQRRKTIHNSLSHGLDLPKEKIREVLEAVSINANERPERLSPEQFVALGRHLAS